MEIRYRKKGIIESEKMTVSMIDSVEYKMKEMGKKIREVCLEKDSIYADENGKQYDIVKFNCPVIRKSFARHGKEAAEELCKKTDCVVIYDYSWRNGFGSGVVFPASFKIGDVVFIEKE